ncbi:MAG: TPM domain-containing protein [Bacteroidetes bacterium]|nr:MAG: TPM domain-containing protein [Bacteroidota bacterium]
MNWFRNKARDFFSPDEDRKIIAAIREAEANTSGEIRIHLESHLRGKAALARAREVFAKLRMHRTAERNGVLIYFATEDKRFAIFADEGIHKAVPPNFWDHIAENMHDHFQKKQFVEGIVTGTRSIGQQLKAYFPRLDTDVNELPDEISYK